MSNGNSKYRKIDPRIWNDAKFMSMSDNAKLVFFFLLTHPHMTSLGAMRGSLAGLAEELGWGSEAFREAFREGLSKGMVKHDQKACLIALPNFIKYNPPESPNVLIAWSKSVDLLPECDLKNDVLQSVKDFTKGLSEAFQEAFDKSMPKTMANQEQEQEQEQEYKNTVSPDPEIDGLPSLSEEDRQSNETAGKKPSLQLVTSRKKPSTNAGPDPNEAIERINQQAKMGGSTGRKTHHLGDSSKKFHMSAQWEASASFKKQVKSEGLRCDFERIQARFVKYWCNPGHNHDRDQAGWELLLLRQIRLNSKPPKTGHKNPTIGQSDRENRHSVAKFDQKAPQSWPQAYKIFTKDHPEVVTEEVRRRTQAAYSAAMAKVGKLTGSRSARGANP